MQTPSSATIPRVYAQLYEKVSGKCKMPGFKTLGLNSIQQFLCEWKKSMGVNVQTETVKSEENRTTTKFDPFPLCRLSRSIRRVVRENCDSSVNTFQKNVVSEVIKDVLEEKLEGAEYDPSATPGLTKEITNAIQQRVKDLDYDRYKLVVQVSIGELKGQAARVASRCLWDTETDSCSSEFYQNSSLFCVAMVFGTYFE